MPRKAPHTVTPPAEGVWRVGYPHEPVVWARSLEKRLRQVDDPSLPPVRIYGWDGGRFDSLTGAFGTTYFATAKKTALKESLADLRPSPKQSDELNDEFRRTGRMPPGNLPADWRHRRIIVRMSVTSSLPFVDVSHSDTIDWLQDDIRLQQVLDALGMDIYNDLGTVVGKRGPITRLISDIVYYALDEDQRYKYGGIRYCSRFGTDLECWAVHDKLRGDLNEISRTIIGKDDSDLSGAAGAFGLNIH